MKPSPSLMVTATSSPTSASVCLVWLWPGPVAVWPWRWVTLIETVIGPSLRWGRSARRWPWRRRGGTEEGRGFAVDNGVVDRSLLGVADETVAVVDGNVNVVADVGVGSVSLVELSPVPVAVLPGMSVTLIETVIGPSLRVDRSTLWAPLAR